MQEIYLLTDYKKQFGSKWGAIPYRGGFELDLLKQNFKAYNYSIVILGLSEVQKLNEIEDKIFLYTSSEDIGFHYKSYIEDVVLYLEKMGARVIPGYDYLRANNNKSYMELIRKRHEFLRENSIQSWSLGSLEELQYHMDDFQFPMVVKKSAGAMSKGVFLASNKKELIKFVKNVSRTKYFFEEIKSYLRLLRHKDYKIDSGFRRKFIIQEYVPDLKNDWKVLVYYDKVFVLERGVNKGDFRASGSKFNYLAGSNTKLPDGFLDFVCLVRKEFDVPNISLDIVFDGSDFHIIEFQAIHFGTSTYNMSDIYYEKKMDNWVQKENTATIEMYYTESVISYLNQ